LVGHRTDEIVRPGHARQGTDAFPEDALDEQKLLDRLSQSAALPGSKGDETVPAPAKIEDCKLDLAGHTFVDRSGREVRLTRAETALLTALVDSPRRVLSRDQLRYAVAGRGAEPYDRMFEAGRCIGLMQGLGYASRLVGVCPAAAVTLAACLEPKIADTILLNTKERRRT
jgi:hypothetical protein